MAREMMTKAQVCQLLHISISTLNNWIRGGYQSGQRIGEFKPEGFPKPIRIGRGIRFFADEIESFIAGAYL